MTKVLVLREDLILKYRALIAEGLYDVDANLTKMLHEGIDKLQQALDNEDYHARKD
jgi:hypothetical protein